MMPNALLRSALARDHVKVPSLVHRHHEMRWQPVPEDPDPVDGLLPVTILEQERRHLLD